MSGSRILAALFAALVCLAGTASVLAVSEKYKGDGNHWLDLAIHESSYGDVKAAMVQGQLPPALWPRARELAVLYREQNKVSEASAIYRALWAVTQSPDSFVQNALDLASVYSDMSGFKNAAEIYKQILAFDAKRFSSSDWRIARDYNNLATCYRSLANTTADKATAAKYLQLAKDNIVHANSTGAASGATCGAKAAGVTDCRRFIYAYNNSITERDINHVEFEAPDKNAFFRHSTPPY